MGVGSEREALNWEAFAWRIGLGSGGEVGVEWGGVQVPRGIHGTWQ